MGGWVGGERGQGGSIGLAPYEVKKKRKIALSFTSPEKDFFLYL
jgi:hypothetical protein